MFRFYSIFNSAYMQLTTCLCFLKGFYCEDSGLSEPTGPCDAGFYCPGGQNVSSPAEYECSPGHYCEVQSTQEQGCPSGTYQNEFGQVSGFTISFTKGSHWLGMVEKGMDWGRGKGWTH